MRRSPSGVEIEVLGEDRARAPKPRRRRRRPRAGRHARAGRRSTAASSTVGTGDRTAASRSRAMLPLQSGRDVTTPGADRRRPGDGPRRLPDDPRGRAGHRGRRPRRPTASRRSRPGAPLRARRRPDGHPDAARRRARGDPPDPRRRTTRAAGDHADHVRPRRVRLRGAVRGRQRLPAQELLARAARPGRSTWSASGDALLDPAVTRRVIERFAESARARRPSPGRSRSSRHASGRCSS